GAGAASLVSYTSPAVAVFLGVLVANEPLTPFTVMGFGLILVGSWLSTRKRAAKPVGPAQVDALVRAELVPPVGKAAKEPPSSVFIGQACRGWRSTGRSPRRLAGRAGSRDPPGRARGSHAAPSFAPWQ